MLPAGGSCLLGSMNLSEYVVNPYTSIATFAIGAFIKDVATAVDALNDVLDEGLPLHPLQEQRDSVKKWRQIGLGVMGLSDMLIKLGIKYGSEEAAGVIHNVFRNMITAAVSESSRLAYADGVFDGYNASCITESDFYAENVAYDSLVDTGVRMNGLRNSQLLTVAPTGTISTMLGCSSGLEPQFALEYNRTTKTLHDEDVVYKVRPFVVQEYMDKYGIKDISDLPEYFITASDIHYEDRVKTQAIIQKYIDASISSTVNAPNDFTVEDVEKLYISAWKNGLKGITFFRDGCERAGILTTDNSDKCEDEGREELKRGYVKKVGDDAIGLERHLRTGCGSLHCCAFFDRNTGDLLETYLNKGSKGGCLSSLAGLSRMISVCARGGIGIDYIVDQLSSAPECTSYAVRRAKYKDTSKGNCCPTAVGYALKDMYDEMQRIINDTTVSDVVSAEDSDTDSTNKCPECGDALVAEGGCVVCKSCGWSRCG